MASRTLRLGLPFYWLPRASSRMPQRIREGVGVMASDLSLSSRTLVVSRQGRMFAWAA